MEKLKLSLLQKWEIPQKYSFVHSSAVLSDGRERENDFDK